jgi:hypothetical protein
VAGIPFQQHSFYVNTIGQFRNRIGSNVQGNSSNLNKENLLMMVNEYARYTGITDGTDIQKEIDDNLSPVHTYDGKVMMRAGCPKLFKAADDETSLTAIPTVGTGAAAGTNVEYVRLLPIKIDNLGRWTFGDYNTRKSVVTALAGGGLATINLAASTFNSGLEDFQVHFKVDPSDYNKLLLASDPAASRTIEGSIYNPNSVTGQSCYVGQYLYSVERQDTFLPFVSPTSYIGTFNVYRCTIEQVTFGSPDEIVVGEFKKYNKDTGVWENSANLRTPKGSPQASSPFMSNILVAVYGSADNTFGYSFRELGCVGYDAGPHTLNYTIKHGTYSTFTSLRYELPFLFLQNLLASTIDEEVVRLPLPKVNSLAAQGSATVMTDAELLYFSDLSVGGNIEMVTPFDNIPFGSTDKGKVTGVFATESYLVAFRELEAYLITGNIFLLNYRVQSYFSTRIGLSDPRGIVEIEGQGMFPSVRGFFLAGQGGRMQEISDIIEPMFIDNALNLNLDMKTCKAVIDYKREYVHFLIKSGSSNWIIVSYSYYHNEWFLLDGINGSGGICELDKTLYISDGTNILKEGSTEVNSLAYYASNFETLGEPSLYKKFLQSIIFCTDMQTAGVLTIKNYHNWDFGSVDTNQQETIGGSKKMVSRRYNPIRSYATALRLESASGQPIKLDGYEYEFVADVALHKDED